MAAKTGLLALSRQDSEQISKTVGSGGSSNFATVAIASAEEGCNVEIQAFTEKGAVVIHKYFLIRKAGASAVTAVKYRDTVIDDVEATEEIDIGVSVSTDTVTFSINGTAFLASTDVDLIIIVTKLKSGSSVTLTSV